MTQERIDSADQGIKKSPQVESPETKDAPAKPKQNNDKVRVVHGVNQGYYNLSGNTVGKTRKSLTDVYNIPSDAKALVDGKEVSAEFILLPGMQLEFIKAAGEKG